jgi:hypothetical protein
MIQALKIIGTGLASTGLLERVWVLVLFLELKKVQDHILRLQEVVQ